MSRQPMKVRTIRVPDDVWEAALETAEENDEILSKRLQEYLARYAAKKLREKREQAQR